MKQQLKKISEKKVVTTPHYTCLGCDKLPCGCKVTVTTREWAYKGETLIEHIQTYVSYKQTWRTMDGPFPKTVTDHYWYLKDPKAHDGLTTCGSLKNTLAYINNNFRWPWGI